MNYTLKAWDVMLDVEASYFDLITQDVDEESAEYPNFRLMWILTITLMRTVGHVLEKIDSKRDRNIKKIINNKYEEWKHNKEQHWIYWKFIVNERNNILKEYNINVTFKIDEEYYTKYPQYINKSYKNMFPSYKDTNENALDYLREAKYWWIEQLTSIEKLYKETIL